MQCDAKVLNMLWFGVLWSLKVTEITALCSTLRNSYLAFHINYVPILYRLLDIARYRSKVIDFNPPHLYLAPPLDVIPLKFRSDLCVRKLESSCYRTALSA